MLWTLANGYFKAFLLRLHQQDQHGIYRIIGTFPTFSSSSATFHRIAASLAFSFIILPPQHIAT